MLKFRTQERRMFFPGIFFGTSPDRSARYSFQFILTSGSTFQQFCYSPCLQRRIKRRIIPAEWNPFFSAEIAGCGFNRRLPRRRQKRKTRKQGKTEKTIHALDKIGSICSFCFDIGTFCSVKVSRSCEDSRATYNTACAKMSIISVRWTLGNENGNEVIVQRCSASSSRKTQSSACTRRSPAAHRCRPTGESPLCDAASPPGAVPPQGQKPASMAASRAPGVERSPCGDQRSALDRDKGIALDPKKC